MRVLLALALVAASLSGQSVSGNDSARAASVITDSTNGIRIVAGPTVSSTPYAYVQENTTNLIREGRAFGNWDGNVVAYALYPASLTPAQGNYSLAVTVDGDHTVLNALSGVVLRTGNVTKIDVGGTFINIGTPGTGGLFVVGGTQPTGWKNNTGFLNTYGGLNTLTTSGGIGQMFEVGGANTPGLTAAITTATLVTVGTSTAAYMIGGAVYCNTAVATATVALRIDYTDPGGTAQSIAPTAAACTTLGTASLAQIPMQLIRAKNATTITYAVAVANSPNYDVSVSVQQVSSN